MLTGMWKKGNPGALLDGNVNGTIIMGNSMEFPFKNKRIIILFLSSNPTWIDIPKENEKQNLKS